MKKDTFEKFVLEHRDEFDDKSPAEKTWRGISASLFGSKRYSPWNSIFLWRAAAVILMGTSVYLFFNKQLPHKEVNPQANQQDFKDIESFYTAQISEKAALISNEGLFADDSFTQDIQKLEAMYAVISEEMKKHPSEKVKDALVLNMLVRIDLLNQQIQKLEESKEQKEPATAI